MDAFFNSLITVSVAGSEAGWLAAESRMIRADAASSSSYTASSADAVRNRRLCVIDGRRHGSWRRIHVHHHHRPAATALALRQQDLRVQFLQLGLRAITRVGEKQTDGDY